MTTATPGYVEFLRTVNRFLRERNEMLSAENDQLRDDLDKIRLELKRQLVLVDAIKRKIGWSEAAEDDMRRRQHDDQSESPF